MEGPPPLTRIEEGEEAVYRRRKVARRWDIICSCGNDPGVAATFSRSRCVRMGPDTNFPLSLTVKLVCIQSRMSVAASGAAALVIV